MPIPINKETGQPIDNRRKSNKVRENHPNAKLTQIEVDEIRRLAAEGVSTEALVERFGVKKTAINSIKSGQTWRPIS